MDKKEITNDELAQIIKEGFKEADLRTDKKIENLAVMVQNGFMEINEKMDKGFRDVRDDIKADLNKKIDVFTHKDLEYRVEKLEEKNGLAGIKSAAVA